MATVNWDAFAKLPGAPEFNFEMLCRALIRRQYGQYGDFAARAAQPGVEFHLNLHTQCSLGAAGRWYGWQCRWYALPSGRAIGPNRRKKVEESLNCSETVIPGLSDWVLWTRWPLTKGDQDWFFGLATHLRLHLWTAAEVEEHLSGEAEVLRRTYFGDLVLTPEMLTTLHTEAVAPIRARWMPEVHQVVEAERLLRRMLVEDRTWDDLNDAGRQLEGDTASVDADISDLLRSPLLEAAREVTATARTVAAALREGYAILGAGDLDLLRQHLNSRPPLHGQTLAALPRQLRAIRHRAALSITNTLADIRRAHSLFDEIAEYASKRLVAIVAEAGSGKTQFAAQITSAGADRPAGILLHGRALSAGTNLDVLARATIVQGSPVPSMEALLAALDAAGRRAFRRLPLIIDGLNEAEDPRDWKGPLAALDETLKRYPYVLVACTVRPAFAEESLPDTIQRLLIPDFDRDTFPAIRKYFNYYRINPGDTELPLDLLRHPLTLRLFCEVTNLRRERTVGVESMPQSLVGLFDRYLEQAMRRIADLAPRTRRYYEHDVRTAIDEIGAALWQSKARSLDLNSLRCRLGDGGRPWNESIVRALEQDGVLIRMPGDTSSGSHVAVLYDALAGHMIADAVLGERGRRGLEEWLREPTTTAALFGSMSEIHPLATDILAAMVGIVPRRLHRQQLWPLLEEPARGSALRHAAYLEGTYLDAATVSALSSLVTEHPGNRLDLLERLRHTRATPEHPLNAEFLDTVLRALPVSQRDLRWTEWVRRRRDDILFDIQTIEKRWRNVIERHTADDLRARWIMWTLTSTVNVLRDGATRALYWYGRGEPGRLFDLTINSLSVNDAYVSERLLAASYGVAMAHQIPSPEFTKCFSVFLSRLCDALCGPTATHPTSHWLSRLHVRGMISLARTYYPSCVPCQIESRGRISFGSGPAVEAIGSDDPRCEEVDSTLHMDFKNYTLGRLFHDRHNYHMEHIGHRAAVAHVCGTAWALGWRATGLGAVDRDLVSNTRYGDRARIERYGKKYGWIAFYTYAGIMDDWGLLRNERLSDIHIDPSFPDAPPRAPIVLPEWANAEPQDDQAWIRSGDVQVPNELLYNPEVPPHGGPWILVDGYLQHKSPSSREVFGFITALLVAKGDADRLVGALKTREYPGNHWLPEEPSDYYTFAGEIPWSPEVGCRYDGDYEEGLYCRSIDVDCGSPIKVEILSHRFAWESYHSQTNDAGGAQVPSRSFSSKFGLRGIPQSFNQQLGDGSVASLSFNAPAHFDGHLLYLREDLLAQYAADRSLIWFVWGERTIRADWHTVPHWLKEAHREYANIWRQVRRAEELSAPMRERFSDRTGRGRRG